MNSARRLARRPLHRKSRYRQQAFLRQGLRAEQLEARTMMATDMVANPFISAYWNVQQPLDVNSDGAVTSADALVVIDQLNAFGSRSLSGMSLASLTGEGSEGEQSESATPSQGFVDVNNDGYLTAADALMIIDDLNAEGEPGDEVAYYFAAVLPGTDTPLPGNQIAAGAEFDFVIRVQDLRGPSPDEETLKRGVATAYIDVLLDNPSLISVHVNEVQQLQVVGSSGTFTLSLDGAPGNATSPITVTSNKFAMVEPIRNALQTKFGDANGVNDFEVSYDGTRFNIKFTDKFGDQNLNNLVAVVVTGTPTVNVTELRPGDRTNPNAFREAFRSQPDVPEFNPAYYQRDLFAVNQGTFWDDVGAQYLTTDGPYPGIDELELVRVRLNADDAGQITFGSSFSNIAVSHVTNLYSRFVGETSVPTVPFSLIQEPTPLTITITSLITANPDTITLNEDASAFTFNPVAQAPQVPAAGIGQDVKNAGAAAGNLRITAVNGVTTATSPGAALTLPSGSTVFFNPSTTPSQTTITYTPAPNLSGVAAETFTYTISDGVNFDTTTVTVNLNAINDRPINRIGGVDINNTVRAATEDTEFAFTGSSMLSVADVDLVGNMSVSLAITSTAGTPGVLNLSTTTGLTISGNGTANINLSGSLTNVNAALNSLVYDPALNFNGQATLTITSTDNLALSSTTANSTVLINVGAENDAPVNSVPPAQNVVESTILVFSSAGGNAITIADEDAAAGTIDGGRLIVTITPADGANGRAVNATAASGAIVTQLGNGAIQIRGTVAQINATLNGMTYSPGPFAGDGSDTITIVTNDQGNTGSGGAQSDTDFINITIEPAVRPLAVNDSFAFNEGQAIPPLDVMKIGSGQPGEDLFTDGSTPFIDDVEAIPAVQGSVAVSLGDDGVPSGDDRIVYTPPAGNPDYFGTITFTYTVNENPATLDGPSTATVTLVINNVNDNPVAANDPGYSTNEDTLLTVNAVGGVLTNDSDVDNQQDIDGDGDIDSTQTLHAVLVTDAAHGTLTLNADGSFTYQPDLNYSGPDSFTYQVTDHAGGTSNIATVSITVNPVNDKPNTNPNTYTIQEDGTLDTLAQSLPSVLANDSDVESNPLTAEFVAGSLSPAGAGSLSLSSNGHIVFTPTADLNGTVTFRYRANDGQGANNLSDETLVTIIVNPVNDAPVAVDDPSVTVVEDTPAIINVAANDTDVDSPSLRAGVIVTQPSHGSVSINANGTVTYTPHLNYVGPDSFTYRASDALLTSANVATVTINVTPVNDAPVAVNDGPPSVVYTATEDTVFNSLISVLANDTDVEGSDLDVVPGTFIPRDASNIQRGTVVMDVETGMFIYTPPQDFNGTVTFTYQATDGSLPSNVATVQITVAGDNDAPVAGDDEFTAIKDLHDQTVPVLGNDTDVENDTLNVTQVIGLLGAIGSNNGSAVPTAHGSVRLVDGVIKYTPASNYSGPDTFDYTVSDGDKTDVGTVDVDVIAFIPKTISGIVFIDTDGNGLRFGGEAFVDGSNGKPANGVYDNGESFIDSASGFYDNNVYDGPEKLVEGVTIQLTGTQKLTANDPGVDIGVIERVTDANGRYEFTGDATTQFLGLAPGDYFVTQVQPEFMESRNAVNNVAISNDALLASKASVNSFRVIWDAEQSIETGHLHGLDFTEKGINVSMNPGSGEENEILWMYSLPGFDGMATMEVDVDSGNLDWIDVTINGVTKRIYQSLTDLNGNATNVGGNTPPSGSTARFRVLRHADGTSNMMSELLWSSGRNGLIFAVGDGIIIRLDGTAEDFGFDLASSVEVGEGELAVDGEFAEAADEVFAGEAWA